MFLGEAADLRVKFRSWGIWGLGLRVEGSGLELRCGVQGLKFRAWGFRCGERWR